MAADATRTALLAMIRGHIIGLREKVRLDFSKGNVDREIAALRGDPVYPSFALDTPEYALVRLMGRISISIGRRLGEIYDKLPRLVAAARFGLASAQVAQKIDGLALDICLSYSDLSASDRVTVKAVTQRTFPKCTDEAAGLGIEIRYNFNPNDSARLRKDVQMAEGLARRGLFPIYMVFSAISPRDEAIRRLERGGWSFVVGAAATAFAYDLFGLDITTILAEPDVKAEIERDMAAVLREMIDSYAFRSVADSDHNAP